MKKIYLDFDNVIGNLINENEILLFDNKIIDFIIKIKDYYEINIILKGDEIKLNKEKKWILNNIPWYAQHFNFIENVLEIDSNKEDFSVQIDALYDNCHENMTLKIIKIPEKFIDEGAINQECFIVKDFDEILTILMFFEKYDFSTLN